MAVGNNALEKLSLKSSSVTFKNVTKKFLSHDGSGEFIAVNKINLNIEAGELTTLLGPSGCGKTTSLRMVAGFENLSAGDIYIGDDPIKNIPPNKRDMAMMFQSYALFPHLTIYENIAYGLRLKKLPKSQIKERTQAVIDLMQISGMEDRLPAQVSGGQQQRVALARAIVIEPRVLLFDEPLSNLDAKLREYMRDELRSLQQRLGITSLYVTHDQSEAMAISDRVVLMNEGNIVQIGSPREIYENPNSKFVANFIGKSNFIQCQVEEKNNKGATIKVNDVTVNVPKPGEWAPKSGEKATMVIRPESIHLVEVGGIFKGKVSKAIYYGSKVEYDIKINGANLVIEDYNPRMTTIFHEGDSVGVDLDLECIRLLPEEE